MDHLKKLRVALGFTQGQFCTLFGLHQAYYSRFENGDRTPSKNFVKTGRQFGISKDFLISGKHPVFIEPVRNKLLYCMLIAKKCVVSGMLNNTEKDNENDLSQEDLRIQSEHILQELLDISNKMGLDLVEPLE
jgi:transcriptional regulator with XRE-family HTH domain